MSSRINKKLLETHNKQSIASRSGEKKRINFIELNEKKIRETSVKIDLMEWMSQKTN